MNTMTSSKRPQPRRRAWRAFVVTATVLIVTVVIVLYVREWRDGKGQPHPTGAVTQLRTPAGARTAESHLPAKNVTKSPPPFPPARQTHPVPVQHFRSFSPVAYGPIKNPAEVYKGTLNMMRLSGDSARDVKTMAPLLKAIIYGRADQVESILAQKRIPVDTIVQLAGAGQGGSETLLDIAIQAGQRGVIKMLLALGASTEPNNSLQPGNSPGPLVSAASLGEDDVVQMLLNQGANVNQKTWDGSTALALAIGGENYSTVRLLVEHGANIDAAVNFKYADGLTMKQIIENRISDPAGLAIRNYLVAHGAHLPSGN